MKQYCNKLTIYFGRSFLPLAVLLIVMIYAVYLLDSRARTELISQSERQYIAQQNDILSHEIAHAVNNLKVMAKNQFLRRYIDGELASGPLVERDFLHFAQANSQYDQIRFIDKSGMERIRINRLGGEARIASAGQLQGKADRYYFQDTLQLAFGEIYFSRFDLNMEKGAIEQPHKPMLRIATPVVDSEGHSAGIMVINYSGIHILNQIGGLSSLSHGDVVMLDNESYYLRGLNANEEWGFMFEDRATLNFSNQFPQAWQQFSDSNAGQFALADGLFTYQKFYPAVYSNESLHGDSHHAQTEGDSRGSGYFWVVASIVAAPVIDPAVTLTYLLAGLILLVFLAIYSWINARANCQRMLAEQELVKQATRDKLTGLANRHLFYERANQVLAQSERMQRSFAVLFIDLDRFKQVNDQLGHEAGDALLLEASQRMRAILRKPDTVARFGGDEFILLIPEMKDLDSVYTIARKVIAALSEPVELTENEGKVEVSVGASIGISIYPDNGDNIDALITAADAAMYQAKNSGTGQFCIARRQ